MENLEKQIENYNKAEAALNLTIADLNVTVSAFMQENPSIEDVYELIDKLPKRYHGIRRMYEYIRKDDARKALESNIL